uniref:G-protein coupled receptors family 1 profile domain-containing protein n=1 Tax=Tetranychus urticae TaxID=32264 RepID=T1L4T8_TETUR
MKFGQLFSFSWEIGPIPCKFVHYMQNVSAICSVYTLTAMSIERYYAILHPVKSRYMCTMSHTRMIIVLTWIFSLISASPIIHLQVHIEVGERYKAFWCYKDPSQPIIWKLYECYMLTLILVIPCIVMGFTYSCICKKLWIVVIKMLVAVVILFILCWSPILIINVLTAFGKLHQLNYGFLKPLRTAAHLLSYLNSCINPLVYGFMSKNFRASFKAALQKCLACRSKGNQRSNSLSCRISTTVLTPGPHPKEVTHCELANSRPIDFSVDVRWLLMLSILAKQPSLNKKFVID